MIPVRISTDDPITIVGGVRPPLPVTHPLAATPCPVCDGPLTDRPITLVAVGIDPETRADLAGRGKKWGAGAAVTVHADCAGLETTLPIQRNQEKP